VVEERRVAVVSDRQIGSTYTIATCVVHAARHGLLDILEDGVQAKASLDSCDGHVRSGDS